MRPRCDSLDGPVVDAMLGLQPWSHELSLAALASAHGGEHQHEA